MGASKGLWSLSCGPSGGPSTLQVLSVTVALPGSRSRCGWGPSASIPWPPSDAAPCWRCSALGPGPQHRGPPGTEGGRRAVKGSVNVDGISLCREQAAEA